MCDRVLSVTIKAALITERCVSAVEMIVLCYRYADNDTIQYPSAFRNEEGFTTTKRIKKKNIFPSFGQEEKSPPLYLPTHSRLISLWSMFLVTFLTVNRSGAIWFKWHLTFLPTVRTRNRVHLSWSTIKTLSSSVKTSSSHHVIPPSYNGRFLHKYLEPMSHVDWSWYVGIDSHFNTVASRHLLS
jgi:hypothetical protein